MMGYSPDLEILFQQIEELMKSRERIVVAIDGQCTSGKTTLADLLSQRYDCNVFHMDHFFLRPEQRSTERLEETGGNVDRERFQTEVIDGILSGKEFPYRPYDCTDKELKTPINVMPKRLNVVEGAYSMHPSLVDSYDLKVLMEIDQEMQRQRIWDRNGPKMYQRFITEWIPMEDRYLAEMGIREKSNLVFQSTETPR